MQPFFEMGRLLWLIVFLYQLDAPKQMETPRRTLKKDASNFDDYLVVGLVITVIVALFAALVIL